MSDVPFSNRELIDKFQSVTDKIEAVHNELRGMRDGEIRDIKAQTQKTNGRVSALENWRMMIVGGAIMVTVVASLVTYIFNSEINNLKEKIRGNTELINKETGVNLEPNFLQPLL